MTKTFKQFIVEEKLPTIYCDMDGVLADFERGANQTLIGFGYPDWFSNHWKEYPQEKADELRWEIIKKKKFFWRDLPPMGDALALWRFIQKYNPHILSHAIKYMPTAKPEKTQWLKRVVGLNNPSVTHLVDNRGDKRKYATYNGHPNILIDDYGKNCAEWKDAGGIAIHHTSAVKTISELKSLGFK